MSNLRLTLAQMTSVDDVAINLSKVEKLLAQAAKDKSDLIVFPENTLYFRIRGSTNPEGVVIDGPELARLSEVVGKCSTSMMLTTPLSSGGSGGKLANATILFEPGRPPQVLYTKIHLFDVDVVGAPSVRESDNFSTGKDPRLFDFKGWKLGLSICYDLRFAELYGTYSQKADLILVPSAFLVPTGEAHWHVLLRARAIESQCYVAAPAQSGEHRSVEGGEPRRTFGHSLAVDPWGRVLGELTESPKIQTFELDKDSIARVRRQIPMDSHRRL